MKYRYKAPSEVASAAKTRAAQKVGFSGKQRKGRRFLWFNLLLMILVALFLRFCFLEMG